MILFPKQLKPYTYGQMLKRGRIALGVWCFLTGAAAVLIFPPYAGNWQGFAAMVLFLAVLLVQGETLKKYEENGSGDVAANQRGSEEKKEKRAALKSMFWPAYIFGFVFYAVSFSWINNALLLDGDKFVAFVPAVFFGIGLFFGLFWGIPAAVASLGRNIYARALLLCGTFVFLEWVRSFIFTGFPWNLLGTALAFDVRAIQGAAYIGTYGLSLLLLLMCCGAAMLLGGVFQKRFYKGALLFILLPAAFLFWNAGQYQKTDEGSILVRLVQPSIPQTYKWEPAEAYANFRSYIDLSLSKPLKGIKLVVWGETATPYFLDRDEAHLREITEAVPPDGFLITGLLRAGVHDGRYVPYNSMFVIDEKGEIKDYYDKVHLVPFGEYLPFRELWPSFMAPVANVVGDLGRGEKYKNMQISGLPLLGGAICYESIFPKQVLNPRNRPEILVVVANDGWYGVSAGPFQHLAAAQMRAVEEGITVIRSANTGISAIIAPNGDMSGIIGLNEKGISDTALPKVLAKKTLYGQFGNLIPGILVLLCWVLGWCLKRGK